MFDADCIHRSFNWDIIRKNKAKIQKEQEDKENEIYLRISKITSNQIEPEIDRLKAEIEENTSQKQKFYTKK